MFIYYLGIVQYKVKFGTLKSSSKNKNRTKKLIEYFKEIDDSEHIYLPVLTEGIWKVLNGSYLILIVNFDKNLNIFACILSILIYSNKYHPKEYIDNDA